MRITRILLFYILGLAALPGCSPQFSIDGSSTKPDYDGQKLYLRTIRFDGTEHTISLDSCEVVHCTFQFNGATDSVEMADLYWGNDWMMPIVIEPGSMFVEIDENLQSVSGGRLNERLNKFLVQQGRCERELRELNSRAHRMLLYGGMSIGQVEASIKPMKASLVKKMNNLEVQFVKDNYDNVLGTGYFMRMCNSLGMPTKNDAIYDILVNAPDVFLKHPYVLNYIYLMGLTPEQLQKQRTQHQKGKKGKRKK